MTRANEIKEQISRLAMRLVMTEAEDPETARICLSELEEIRDSAQRLHAPALETAASELVIGVTSAKHPLTTLSEGLSTLENALDQPVPSDPHHPASPAPLSQDPELMNDFILESGEHLSTIETQVLALERDPHDSEALNAAFRGFHTIKGLAGFLELWAIQKLAHDVETILDRARNGQVSVDSRTIDLILAGADYLRQWLAHLQAVLQGQPSDPPTEQQNLHDRIALVARAEVGSPAGAETQSCRAPSPTPAKTGSIARGRQSESMSVKVDTSKLDYLVDMAGEMVIAESLVRHDSELSAIKNPLLQRKVGHLTRITTELQKTAMAMRLVPIGPLFRRMARLVRDLSRQFEKTVEMETQGDDIELDRTIVEELADPLMHMVRNALDHGIESRADRERVGKPASARLLLRAIHQAGQVVIEITDDGRGLDREKILAKAISKGLVSSGDGLSDGNVYDLIFEPGFSTATTVTSVSGRGVGMDVVRRHIEKLRGRIEIRSEVGQGATFLLKLPLTLAIIEGLVVGVGTDRYIVPMFAIRELFRPGAETVWTVHGRAEMALVRGSLLPVVRLYRIFGAQPKSEDPTRGVLIVAEVEGCRFCVLVDEVLGKQEVVIKALGELFKNAPGIAGGAILGDGRVGLILDVDRLFRERSCGVEA